MSPEEFIRRCDEILVERADTLKTHQAADIHLYKRLIKTAGKVTSTDEYYLTVVGVPYRGYLLKQKPRIGKKINAIPQKLF